MDWETPIEGSCFLGTDEQCVEKAASLLSTLRQQLVSLKDLSTTRSPDRPSSRVGDFERPITPTTVRSPIKSSEQQLIVRGSRTGQKKLVNITDVRSTPPGSAGAENKLDWSKADNVIAKSLSLIMKLEKDRCETMKQLETEKQKVNEMRQKLDEKARERLRLLADIVQNEHEQCLQDMLEMKWHVGFEGRHLKQIQDDVRLIVDKNLELKKNVEGLSKQFALLEQKIDSQTNTMAEITHKQLETNKKLKNKQNEHLIAKQKAHQTRENTEAEIKQMDRMIAGLKKRLEAAQKDYEESIEQQERILQSINLAKEKMENFDSENGAKKELLERTKISRNITSDRVGALKDTSFHIQIEIEGLKGENTQLSLAKKDCLAKLKDESTVLQKRLQQKTKDMRDGREKNENFIHSIEDMKEQTIASKKKTADAQKSMKSAEKELTKVDKQLTVIHEQTELSRKNHRELVLQLRENEDAYDHEEYTLKSTVQSIKEELNKETKVKRIYQGKVAANTEDLEKMKAEHRRNYKQLKDQADDAEEGENLENHILKQTTTKYNEKSCLKDELNDKVVALKKEIAQLETELGDAIKSLIPKEAKLNQRAAEINERTNSFKEKESLLSDRIKDIKTSQSAIDRMTNEILTGIDELTTQKEELDAKMAIEKEEEESWKQEYEEIANFSKEAEEKFSKYKIERQDYLEQVEANVVTRSEENQKLASDYKLLRDKHATIKGEVVRSLERTSILEHGVRDKNQLLMLQRRLIETLKIHYEHRGSTGRKAVKKVKTTMEGTKSVVQGLETELTRTLNDMELFLRDIDNEQKQIRLLKKEKELIELEQIKTTRTVLDSKTKSVTFTLPVKCQS